MLLWKFGKFQSRNLQFVEIQKRKKLRTEDVEVGFSVTYTQSSIVWATFQEVFSHKSNLKRIKCRSLRENDVSSSWRGVKSARIWGRRQHVTALDQWGGAKLMSHDPYSCALALTMNPGLWKIPKNTVHHLNSQPGCTLAAHERYSVLVHTKKWKNYFIMSRSHLQRWLTEKKINY